MHEALITKGMVNGNKDQDQINSRFNCVLRHHVCPDGKHSHTPGIGSEEEYALCARQLTDLEGMLNVGLWLQSMWTYFPIVAYQASQRYGEFLMNLGDENDTDKK